MAKDTMSGSFDSASRAAVGAAQDDKIEAEWLVKKIVEL
jgi:hypothetical protein